MSPTHLGTVVFPCWTSTPPYTLICILPWFREFYFRELLCSLAVPPSHPTLCIRFVPFNFYFSLHMTGRSNLAISSSSNRHQQRSYPNYPVPYSLPSLFHTVTVKEETWDLHFSGTVVFLCWTSTPPCTLSCILHWRKESLAFKNCCSLAVPPPHPAFCT